MHRETVNHSVRLIIKYTLNMHNLDLVINGVSMYDATCIIVEMAWLNHVHNNTLSGVRSPGTEIILNPQSHCIEF